jgi:hypothetical protein
MQYEVLQLLVHRCSGARIVFVVVWIVAEACQLNEGAETASDRFCSVRPGGVPVSSYLMLPLNCLCPIMHEKRLREASILQLLLRHFPELTAALDGLPNPFVTWNSPNQPVPSAPAFLSSAYDVENAHLNAQGKRRPGLQNRDPQPLFPADLLVQRLIAQKDIKIDDLPANPVVHCSLKAMLTPLKACLQGAGEVCCAAIDAAFAPSTNASTRNCLCLPPVETTGLAVGLGFGINFDEVRIWLRKSCASSCMRFVRLQAQVSCRRCSCRIQPAIRQSLS